LAASPLDNGCDTGTQFQLQLEKWPRKVIERRVFLIQVAGLEIITIYGSSRVSKPFRRLAQNSVFNGLLICHRHISIVLPVIALCPITLQLRLRVILKCLRVYGLQQSPWTDASPLIGLGIRLPKRGDRRSTWTLGFGTNRRRALEERRMADPDSPHRQE
jgi:hypothetical protein